MRMADEWNGGTGFEGIMNYVLLQIRDLDSMAGPAIDTVDYDPKYRKIR